MVELFCCYDKTCDAAEVLTDVKQNYWLNVGVWLTDEPAHDDVVENGQFTVVVANEDGHEYVAIALL